MKYLLIIGDGMADNELPELGNKTPLEYAETPAFDALANAGMPGSVLTIPEGMPAGSDTATLSIFGCDPQVYYSGRAPIEAAASGIKLSEGDIAYRCNMVTFEDGDMPFEQKKLISHSAGGVEGDVSDTLVTELFETPGFKEAAGAAGMEVFPSGSFRHIAVQNGIPPAPLRLCLKPPHDHIGERLGELLPKGTGNAGVLAELMRSAHGILDVHPVNKERRIRGKLPANGIWLWAEGTAAALPDFASMYGKTGCVISAVPNCQGIGALMGLDVIKVEGATGELHTNYEGKVSAALSALETRDFAAIHIEAPDECSHDGNLNEKLQAIEWVDSRIAAPLVSKLREKGTDFRMLLISDHKTLLSTRGHCGGPVPFVIYDSRRDRKTGLRFCERDAETCNFTENGTELMGMLFDDSDKDG